MAGNKLCTLWQRRRNPGSVQAHTCCPGKAALPSARVTLLSCSSPRDMAVPCRTTAIMREGQGSPVPLLITPQAREGDSDVTLSPPRSWVCWSEIKTLPARWFLLPPSSCLQAAHHIAELHWDDHEAVFKTKYPAFAHGRELFLLTLKCYTPPSFVLMGFEIRKQS